MTFTVLMVLPDLLNVNGDAENARVLARRAQWSGLDCEVTTSSSKRPNLAVIGSGFDTDFVNTRRELERFGPLLRRCAADGVPMLAIGTGFEMLCERIQLSDQSEVDGLGILPGDVLPAPERMNGDLVATSEFGMLVGYENHARSYRLPAGSKALATVISGNGNGSGSRAEGVVQGSVYGTHMHGPFLAKNPSVADHLLSVGTGGAYQVPNAGAHQADTLADLARERQLKRAGIALGRHPQARSL